MIKCEIVKYEIITKWSYLKLKILMNSLYGAVGISFDSWINF